MYGDELRGLDAWITSGRYSASPMIVTCKKCGNTTHVVAETEYGATTWSPEECSACGGGFDGDEEWIEDEPPERDYTDEEIDNSFDAYR